MATPNELFAVLSVSNPAEIEARISGISPWLYLKLEDGQWLVMAPSGTTSKEVSDRVGIAKGDLSGLVVRVHSYFGRKSPSIWEWIATKQGAELGTAASA